jgi:hypothetical protein
MGVCNAVVFYVNSRFWIFLNPSKKMVAFDLLEGFVVFFQQITMSF